MNESSYRTPGQWLNLGDARPSSENEEVALRILVQLHHSIITAYIDKLFIVYNVSLEEVFSQPPHTFLSDSELITLMEIERQRGLDLYYTALDLHSCPVFECEYF